ncbi:DUF2732 family protein [Pantoea agglomerans]|uniref:DUF2732 family protein n=1 Tax=Enterobacter agglomerans TaxID=549 RepID=UPI003AAF1B27
MLNKLSGTTKPGSYIELDMMLNDARREERRGRADLMISRLNILASKIRREELTHVEAAELLNQEAEKIQAQTEEAH